MISEEKWYIDMPDGWEEADEEFDEDSEEEEEDDSETIRY